MDAVNTNRARWIRPVLILVALVAGVILARALGVTDLLRLENFARLKQTIEGYGAAGPFLYIAGYILAVVFFVPGLPITLLGGLAFGPIRGTVYVSIGATIGAGLAFLVARYGLRGTVERWVRSNPRLARMDAAVARDGWRIVMITRLVPLFPFNLQNYAYGLTRIGFWAYLLTSWICMLPGTAAYTFAGGALSEGGGNLRRTLGYLAVAGVLIALVSLIPRVLRRRSQTAGEFLRSVVVVVAAGGLLVASGEPAAAMDSEAYARLVKAHVRSGTVNGIRLHLVDYNAVKTDPAYAQALADFAEAKLDRLGTEADRLAFWANAYNLLAIKAVLDRYPVQSIKDGGSLLRSIWKKKVGTVAGQAYALDDIEHGILRKEFPEPRVHFAIVCASLSCPDLRLEPYQAARLNAQLADAAATFLANTTKGLQPGPDGKTARVSSIFKWFADDFAAQGGVAQFIRRNADRAVAARLAGLTDHGLSYLDYDWSLNDAARAARR
jgi:uncharacterized membrane protein YdjX (TVP38/TMEM64 family)